MPTLGNVNNFANVVVSLDPRKTPYVGIGMTEPGQFKVWLSPQQWCISLPENLTDQEAHEVQLLLNQGVLVPGKVYIPVLVKNQAVLESYLEIGRRSRTLDAKTKLPFQELVKKKSAGGFTAAEILAACIADEDKLRKRDTFIKFYNEGIKAYDGPTVLAYDYSNDPDTYSVVISPNGQIVDDSRGDKKPTPPAPEAKVKDPKKEKAKDKALDKFLGGAI